MHKLGLTLWLAMGLSVAGAAGAQIPSGERHLGKTVIEPGYDDRTGELIYIMTPEGAPLPSHANAHAVSPLFLIVYPSSAAGSVGTMNCAHQDGDNCPDHGPMFSDLAKFSMPSVYVNGVWGHDHIMDGPGGSDFDVNWQIFVVLFTSAQAANTHITTEAQLDAAIETGDAFTVETPIVFHCNLVSAAVYARGTPVPPVGP
jgi:hypothetical protein